MENVKNVYGINFPLPAIMRERTEDNQRSQIKKELCDIIEKMNKATICSIRLPNLSVEAQEILSDLGYTIIAVKDQHDVILYFRVEWYDKQGEDDE